MSAPGYTRADMNRQITAWFAAADAYRSGEPERVADHLSPKDDPRPDSVLYAEQVALAALGAMVTGLTVRELGDGRGTWQAEAGDPRVEPDAVTRFAFHLVADAANGNHDGIPGRVLAFSTPDEAGVQRMCELIMVLLGMFVAAQGGAS